MRGTATVRLTRTMKAMQRLLGSRFHANQSPSKGSCNTMVPRVPAPTQSSNSSIENSCFTDHTDKLKCEPRLSLPCHFDQMGKLSSTPMLHFSQDQIRQEPEKESFGELAHQLKPDELMKDSSSERLVQALLTDALVLDPARKAEFPTDQSEAVVQQVNELMHNRPKISPDQTSVFLFPGQGSQFVGMGKQLLGYPGVDQLYEEASALLGYDLLHLCVHGPRDQLDRTDKCQAAVFVTSLAAVQKLNQDNPQAVEKCVAAAGFSVGEISALVFSGAIDYIDGVRLIKARGEAMLRASELVPSGMMTIMETRKSRVGQACHKAKEYCRTQLNLSEADCRVANYLFPECKVVAGNEQALEWLQEHADEFGLSRMKRLAVSGAFHTDLMSPAVDAFCAVFGQTELRDPCINVHSNVTSKRYRNARDVRRLLSKQLTTPVRWEQTMQLLFARSGTEEFPQVYEVGPGRQLGSMLKRINAKAYRHYSAVTV